MDSRDVEKIGAPRTIQLVVSFGELPSGFPGSLAIAPASGGESEPLREPNALRNRHMLNRFSGAKGETTLSVYGIYPKCLSALWFPLKPQKENGNPGLINPT